MRSIVVVLALAFLPWIASAGSPRYVFALRCPGNPHLVPSFRHDWSIEGDTVQDRFPNIDGEIAFHFSRISARLGGDLGFAYHFLDTSQGVPKKLEELNAPIQWKTGYYIPPAPLGLPESIDGCSVVPLLAQIPSSAQIYVGDADSYANLGPLDQLIVLIAANGASSDVMRSLFGESFDSLKGAAAFDLGGRVRGGTDNHSFFESSPLNKYQPAYGGFVELSADGSFQSASVQYEEQGKQKSAYLEAKPDGTVTRLLPNVNSTVQFLANTTAEEKEFSLSVNGTETLEWQVVASEEDCPTPLGDKDHVRLESQCTVALKVLRRQL